MSVSVKESIIFKFLTTEGVQPSKILQSLVKTVWRSMSLQNSKVWMVSIHILSTVMSHIGSIFNSLVLPYTVSAYLGLDYIYKIKITIFIPLLAVAYQLWWTVWASYSYKHMKLISNAHQNIAFSNMYCSWKQRFVLKQLKIKQYL